MDSLRQAQSYLERDPLRYMDMLEPIRRGMVEVAALREDGVLLYNLPGELYMLAADSVESAQALCAGVGEMELAVAHSRKTGEYLQKRYGIARCQGCTQAAYLGKEPFPAAQGVEIRPLGQEAFSVVFANYHSFSDPKYIRERLDAGVMRGAFAQGQLLGFIGMHSEAAWACWRCCRLTAAGRGPGLDGRHGQPLPGAGLGALLPDFRREHRLFGAAPAAGLDPVPGEALLGDGLKKRTRGNSPRPFLLWDGVYSLE